MRRSFRQSRSVSIVGALAVAYLQLHDQHPHAPRTRAGHWPSGGRHRRAGERLPAHGDGKPRLKAAPRARTRSDSRSSRPRSRSSPCSFRWRSSGIGGAALQRFGLTVAVAVAISGLHALTLRPCSAPACSSRSTAGARWASRSFDNFFGWLDRVYDRLLRGALRRPWIVMGSALVLVAVSVVCFMFMRKELSPTEDRGVAFGIVIAPGSTSPTPTSTCARSSRSSCRCPSAPGSSRRPVSVRRTRAGDQRVPLLPSQAAQRAAKPGSDTAPHVADGADPDVSRQVRAGDRAAALPAAHLDPRGARVRHQSAVPGRAVLFDPGAVRAPGLGLPGAGAGRRGDDGRGAEARLPGQHGHRPPSQHAAARHHDRPRPRGAARSVRDRHREHAGDAPRRQGDLRLQAGHEAVRRDRPAQADRRATPEAIEGSISGGRTVSFSSRVSSTSRRRWRPRSSTTTTGSARPPSRRTSRPASASDRPWTIWTGSRPRRSPGASSTSWRGSRRSSASRATASISSSAWRSSSSTSCSRRSSRASSIRSRFSSRCRRCGQALIPLFKLGQSNNIFPGSTIVLIGL